MAASASTLPRLRREPGARARIPPPRNPPPARGEQQPARPAGRERKLLVVTAKSWTRRPFEHGPLTLTPGSLRITALTSARCRNEQFSLNERAARVRSDGPGSAVTRGGRCEQKLLAVTAAS